ncbi:phosphoadenosine phosphosulfate reductase family protein [Hyphomicrobium sp.]|uniref:phosphoadenosine phosphosulfate reductase domain-containing protein n=1 Tax=Hyphomicrobium sp. TaxID=82 RepID=UPI0025B8581F|nr:phosphoadenosine phosphosulfate reductase family protein [Hyphomicrobium sp.]
MWNLLNGRLGRGETVRVFPLSNWTERDVWFYIGREQLDVVPLYFASVRPTLIRDGQILVIDGQGMALRLDEEIHSAKFASARLEAGQILQLNSQTQAPVLGRQ